VVEVQIRTREMHQRAEWGVAAHWAYKDQAGAAATDIDWLNRIIDWQAEISDPAAFMENLKTDLEQDEVFVFTPKGKVVTLPVGSTTVDFAYAVHTEVGHACIGAKVNGRLVPLHHKMKSGDTCEIFTSKVESAGPTRDWLQFVESPRARNKIKQWFSRERREDMIETGRDELTKELRREGLPVQRIWASASLAQMRWRRRSKPRRTPISTPCWRPSAKATCRPDPSPARWLATSTVTGPTNSCPPRCCPARAPAVRATRRVCTWRASTTCWCASRAVVLRCRATRSSASSREGAACRCTAPTVPTRRA
jgi:TGS domain/Region found in RelA / SpoT proteins